VYILKIWLIFSFYNSTVPWIVELTAYLLSDDFEILLTVRERMGIANRYGNKTRLNLGVGMGMGMNQLGMGENGIEKYIPAHLY